MDPHNNMILIEGMRMGDLSDLVLPLLSIDEFESKIDPEAIVLGFYVTDADAADDLNRFIQRSPIDILDSEVSPAPDQNGHYMVFVELLNNARTVNDIMSLIDEVSPLCDLVEWVVQIRGTNDVIPLDRDKIKAALDGYAAEEREEKQSVGENIGKSSLRDEVLTVLESSDLVDVATVDNPSGFLISIRTLADRADFDLLAFGEASVFEGCRSSPLDYSTTGIAEANRIRRMLGSGWDVAVTGDAQVWSREDEDYLLVKPRPL